MNLLDWVKTLCFNLKAFDFKTAIRMPVYIGWRTKYKLYRGSIIVPQRAKRGSISIGLYPGSSGLMSEKSHSYVEVSKDSVIEFKGAALFLRGSTLKVIQGGV